MQAKQCFFIKPLSRMCLSVSERPPNLSFVSDQFNRSRSQNLQRHHMARSSGVGRVQGDGFRHQKNPRPQRTDASPRRRGPLQHGPGKVGRSKSFRGQSQYST